MKLWWANFIKDYLSFTKKERVGILIAIVLIPSVHFTWHFIPTTKADLGARAFERELAQLRVIVDSGHNAYVWHNTKQNHFQRQASGAERTMQKELFAFDPNTLDLAGWKRLGVREKTIQTIQNFVSKGYKFRRPDDIRKIYGLRSEEADRLVPYVRIAEITPVAKGTSDNHFATFTRKTEGDKFKTPIIDINEADTSEFISLPGIGSKLAARIVNFRQKLGGFFSVKQLAETYGVSDSTFDLIKGRLQCVSPSVTKININTATAADLKRHPYLNWNIANAIVNYRSQHGSYKSVEDLHRIEIITDELFYKISPYLTV